MGKTASSRRPVDMGKVFREASGLLKRHGFSFLLVSAVCMGPAVFVAQWLRLTFGTGFSASFGASVLQSMSQVAATGVIFSMVAMEAAEGRVSLGAAISRIAPRLPLLIGLSWVVGLAATAAAIVVVIPGLIVITVWLLALPVAVFESTSIRESLGRSMDLTRGVRWLTFGVWVILLVIGMLCGGLAGGILGVVGLVKSSGIAGAVAGATVSAPVLAAYFLEVRRSKGGLEAEQIAATFG